MAIYTLRTAGTAHPEDSVLQFFSDVIEAGGVKDMSSTNHFKVTQNGTPDMNVEIAAGNAIVRNAVGNCYPVRNTAAFDVLLANNSSGNPRKDAIVLYIDTAASANSDSSNVAKLTKVQGTPAASPTAPTDSDIQTAVGASNPFLRLADVQVDNAETTILNADITDQRTRFRPKHSNHLATASDGGTITFDVSRNNIHEVTLGGNRTLAVSNPSIGQAFVLNLKQDGTGGRTVTWFSGIRWYGGVPVLTTTANRVDSFGFIYKGSGQYDGYVLGQDGQ